MPRLLVLSFILLGACGGSGDECDFVGDRGAPPEFELRVLDAAGAASAITDSARVPLILPPQGGKVIFASVRARNLCAGVVQLRGWVRDGATSTSPIIGLEGRPVTLVAESDGWAYPGEPTEISSYANIPLCPNASSSRDIFEQPYQLSVRVTDAEQRVVEKSVMVTPFCGEAQYEAECRCTCKQGYVLGSSCS
jgi:hypothetical protein